jgi:hypothetical protein
MNATSARIPQCIFLFFIYGFYGALMRHPGSTPGRWLAALSFCEMKASIK